MSTLKIKAPVKYSTDPVEMLFPCPTAGTGVHAWLYSSTIFLHERGVDPATIDRELTARATRKLQPHEMNETIRNIIRGDYKTDYSKQTQAMRLAQAIEMDYQKIADIVKEEWCLYDLWEESPLRLNDNDPPPEWLISNLFGQENPMVCCAPGSPKTAQTGNLSAFKGLETYSFIVTNPMSSPTGINRAGKVSFRCLDNTSKDRYYFVYESDKLKLDTQAAIIYHLARLMPLKMVVHSGRKSLHAWFKVVGMPQDRIDQFIGTAITLGADKAMKNLCALARMPSGTRYFENGQQRSQVLYYFDPAETVEIFTKRNPTLCEMNKATNLMEN